MKLIRGPFSYDRNLDQVREFLLGIYKQTGLLHYLIPTKIENQKFGPCGPNYSPKEDVAIKIWREAFASKHDEKIVIIWDCTEMKGYDTGSRDRWQNECSPPCRQN